MADDLKRVLKKLRRFGVDTNRAIDQTIRLTALKVQSTAVNSMRTPSEGRQYIRGTVKHTASREGDAPNVDTGRLVGSVRIEHQQGSQVAYVGTDLDYGAYLELLKDRPWLTPALQANEDDFLKNLESSIDRQIKQADQ